MKPYQRDDRIACMHICDQIDMLMEDLHTLGRDGRIAQTVAIRALEVIGEAARRITPRNRQRFDEIPWKAVIGMRNHLIRGYDRILAIKVWDVVDNHLPSLRDQIQAMFDQLDQEAEAPFEKE